MNEFGLELNDFDCKRVLTKIQLSCNADHFPVLFVRTQNRKVLAIASRFKTDNIFVKILYVSDFFFSPSSEKKHRTLDSS